MKNGIQKIVAAAMVALTSVAASAQVDDLELLPPWLVLNVEATDPCRVDIPRRPPYADMVLSWSVYNQVTGVSTYEYTIIRPSCPTSICASPTKQLSVTSGMGTVSQSGTYAYGKMAISQGGRHLAYFLADPPTGTNPRVMYSQNWGETFTAIPLTAAAPFTAVTSSTAGNPQTGGDNLVFDNNGNLHLVYISYNPSASSGSGQLNHTRVDANGNVTYNVVATLAATAFFGPSIPSEFLSVVSTDSDLVAMVSYGETWRYGVAPGDVQASVSAFYRYDYGAQSWTVTHFGPASPGINATTRSNWNMRGTSSLAAPTSLLATDGTNIFVLFREASYSAPGSNTFAQGRIRSFSPSPTNTNRYFINTRPMSPMPYMDLTDPALNFGTRLSDFFVHTTTSPLSGRVLKFAAPYYGSTGNTMDVDLVVELPDDRANAAALPIFGGTGVPNNIKRLRIRNPNNGLQGATPLRVDDYHPEVLQSVLGIPSAVKQGSHGFNSLTPIQGATLLTYAHVFDLASFFGVPVPGPSLLFSSHRTDIR